MEARRDDLEGGLIRDLIEHAVLAAAYRIAAAGMPDCAGGWEKMAQRHSERVRALAGEIGGRTTPGSIVRPNAR